MKGRVLGAAALAGTAAAGAVTAVAVTGGRVAAAPPPPPPVTTATITRTNLATTVLTAGTLGFTPIAPVINQIPGTYTALPQPGAVINPGQALYRVNNMPVVLMKGSTPAWQSFQAGMPGGPDVTELQQNLIALGYAKGLFTVPSGQFDSLTTIAVERWQAAVGYTVTGQVTLGQVIFLPGRIAAGAANVAVGEMASPGQQPYQATATTRIVTVPLGPNTPPASVGEDVSIVLPSNVTIPGKITVIGPPLAAAGAGGTGSTGTAAGTGGSASASATAAGGTPAPAQSVLTIIPADPAMTGTGSSVAVQVSLVSQSVRQVLAVPISALLALAGGGYGVEVITPSGGRRLTAVSSGLFADTEVQVSGPGIRAGEKVVTAQ